MLTDSLEVQLRAVLPCPDGCAVFLGDAKKVFVIYVDPNIGQLLALSVGSPRRDRPLTHDLIGNIFGGFGISLERMVINDAVGETFYARIVLKMENELGVKMVEVDARPSDAMLLSMQSRKPICVASALWKRLPDATAQMEKLLAKAK